MGKCPTSYLEKWLGPPFKLVITTCKLLVHLKQLIASNNVATICNSISPWGLCSLQHYISIHDRVFLGFFLKETAQTGKGACSSSKKRNCKWWTAAVLCFYVRSFAWKSPRYNCLLWSGEITSYKFPGTHYKSVTKENIKFHASAAWVSIFYCQSQYHKLKFNLALLTLKF